MAFTFVLSYETWQNDIRSFIAMTVAMLLECHLMGQITVNLY